MLTIINNADMFQSIGGSELIFYLQKQDKTQVISAEILLNSVSYIREEMMLKKNDFITFAYFFEWRIRRMSGR